SHGSGDAWLLKIDSLWNIQWQRRYGGTQNEGFSNSFELGNGNLLLAGGSTSNDGDVNSHIGLGSGDYDYWVIETDSVGNLIWEKSYGGIRDDNPWKSIQLHDGTYLLSGYTYSHEVDVVGEHDTVIGFSDIWLINIDSAGNLLWQKCLGGTSDDLGPVAFEDWDHGIVVVGSTSSQDGDVSGIHCYMGFCNDAWIVKLDSAGNLLWQKCLGGSDGESFRYAVPLSNGEYIAAGSTFSSDGDVSGGGYHGIANGDAWVVKLSVNSTGLQNSPNLVTDFSVHLNSALRTLYITFYSNDNERTQLQLLDITGRALLEQPLTVTAGFNKQKANTGELSAGVYMVRLITAGGSVVKKVQCIK
ncbi:MAG: T9SS type A sorting domain-containing protein, partial [Bacteroidota bacterium]